MGFWKQIDLKLRLGNPLDEHEEKALAEWVKRSGEDGKRYLEKISKEVKDASNLEWQSQHSSNFLPGEGLSRTGEQGD